MIWQNTKSYSAFIGRTIFFAHPSAKYPNCWWVCKIENGVWEGFERPLTAVGLNYWLSTIPQTLEWSVHVWDGEDMAIPSGEAKMKPAHDVVYFIEAVGLDLVKIGLTSSDANARLSQIQLLSPVELRMVGQMRGSPAKETSLHKQFSAHRVRGEWFNFTPTIKDYIKRNTQ